MGGWGGGRGDDIVRVALQSLSPRVLGARDLRLSSPASIAYQPRAELLAAVLLLLPTQHRSFGCPATGKMEPAPCATCGQPTSKRCAGCGQVSYCSHACQKRGWKRHKKVCRPPTDMATSEVCKVLIDTMRSPEIRNEPDGNVFIDPRQVKVALLCGVPRHRLGPLFRQRNLQWLKENDGASFLAALAASGDAVRPCSEAYFRSIMQSEGSEELVRLIEAGPAASPSPLPGRGRRAGPAPPRGPGKSCPRMPMSLLP